MVGWWWCGGMVVVRCGGSVFLPDYHKMKIENKKKIRIFW